MSETSDAVNGIGADINLNAHVTGNPFPGNGSPAGVTSGHTWLIIVLALVLLWVLGGGVFRKIRMP